MLSETATAWIEDRLGGRIVRVDQQARWREQYFVTVERPEGDLSVVIRFGRDPEIVKLSEMFQKRDIDHEARVLDALQDTDVKVPRFHGYDADERFMILERLSGSDRLADAPNDDVRRDVMFEYYDELATLHSLDVASMQLEGLDIPQTPEDIAYAGKFAWMRDLYLGNRHRLRPEPLLDLGMWWLDEHIPQNDRPVAFVQGDTGPGQFMFEDGHVTGLIDWEMAHIADPMLDLGVARMRNMLYPAGSLRAPIMHYDEVTDGGVDWDALGFYTVLSMLFTPIGVVFSLQSPAGDLADLLPRFEWDITLKRGLCDALAEVLGLELVPPELPEPDDDAPTMADLLTLQLESNVVGLAADDVQRFEVDKAIGLAKGVQLDTRIGARLLSDDLDDMAEVLGRRPDTKQSGLSALGQLVADEPAEHIDVLVPLFARLERRREHLWRPMMLDSAAGAFESLLPARPR